MNPPAENLWVDWVGGVVIARIRGVPTEDLVRECQRRVIALAKDPANTRILYDALELRNPSGDIALTQQSLTASITPAPRIAVLVANTKVALFSRLAFGDVPHRVFYGDMAGALAWLQETGDRGEPVPPGPDRAAKCPTENLWVELVGGAIVARIRGVPTEALIRECQERIAVLSKETACARILYDALELENPSPDIALAQQSLTASMPSAMRIAILVSNSKVAYLSRLAFGHADYRVFYGDMPGALAWLHEASPEENILPFELGTA